MRRTTSDPTETDDVPDRDAIRAQILHDALAHGEDLLPDTFPHLGSISAAFIYRFMPRPTVPMRVEYVYVPLPAWETPRNDEITRVELAIAQWNMAWEADHLRHELFADDLPASLHWLRRLDHQNLSLVPDRGGSRYDAYAPLYHLISRQGLEREGLPLLKRGVWPPMMHQHWPAQHLPRRFQERLGRALARHLWPLLVSGSPVGAFDVSEPLHLLAHNLDFWLPHIDHVAQERMRRFSRVGLDAGQGELLSEARAEAPPGVAVDRPLMGGSVWEGEAEAWEATQALVEAADAGGQLRGILDAVRAHRVEEDFSPLWSHAREDFERRLYRKRNKIKVTFVELRDTVPVHGPEAEVHGDLLWEDFFALLDPKERRVVVCLRRGLTHLGDIARELGYANHSPVSKAMARIRAKATQYLAD